MKLDFDQIPHELKLKYLGSHVAVRGEANLELTRPSKNTIRISLALQARLFPIPKKVADFQLESTWEHFPVEGLSTDGESLGRDWILIGYHEHDRLKQVRHLWERDFEANALVYTRRASGSVTTPPRFTPLTEFRVAPMDPLALFLFAPSLQTDTYDVIVNDGLKSIAVSGGETLQITKIKFEDKENLLQPPVELVRNSTGEKIQSIRYVSPRGLGTFSLRLSE